MEIEWKLELQDCRKWPLPATIQKLIVFLLLPRFEVIFNFHETATALASLAMNNYQI